LVTLVASLTAAQDLKLDALFQSATQPPAPVVPASVSESPQVPAGLDAQAATQLFKQMQAEEKQKANWDAFQDALITAKGDRASIQTLLREKCGSEDALAALRKMAEVNPSLALATLGLSSAPTPTPNMGVGTNTNSLNTSDVGVKPTKSMQEWFTSDPYVFWKNVDQVYADATASNYKLT
jgi:hypothetical protein